MIGADNAIKVRERLANNKQIDGWEHNNGSNNKHNDEHDK